MRNACFVFAMLLCLFTVASGCKGRFEEAPMSAPQNADTSKSEMDAWSAYRRGDHAAAVNIWRELAEQGNVHAQVNLGNMYREGTGVAQDHSKAAEWFRKAAQQGSASGQGNLGLAYAKGEGVAQSDSEAVDWYYKAGLSFIKEGKPKEAEKALGRINQISPGHELGKKLSKAIYPETP